jgi:hypothetical protein
MQLMPGTGARLRCATPARSCAKHFGGTRYLRELLNRFNNRVDLVLASYNAAKARWRSLETSAALPGDSQLREEDQQTVQAHHRSDQETRLVL